MFAKKKLSIFDSMSLKDRERLPAVYIAIACKLSELYKERSLQDEKLSNSKFLSILQCNGIDYQTYLSVSDKHHHCRKT
jgi:hypothetical protein